MFYFKILGDFAQTIYFQIFVINSCDVYLRVAIILDTQPYTRGNPSINITNLISDQYLMSLNLDQTLSLPEESFQGLACGEKWSPLYFAIIASV